MFTVLLLLELKCQYSAYIGPTKISFIFEDVDIVAGVVPIGRIVDDGTVGR
jgi:hypothetical protein